MFATLMVFLNLVSNSLDLDQTECFVGPDLGPVYQPTTLVGKKLKKARKCDFQQYDILTSVDSYEPVMTYFELRNSKCCSVSSVHKTFCQT